MRTYFAVVSNAPGLNSNRRLGTDPPSLSVNDCAKRSSTDMHFVAVSDWSLMRWEFLRPPSSFSPVSSGANVRTVAGPPALISAVRNVIRPSEAVVKARRTASLMLAPPLECSQSARARAARRNVTQSERARSA